MVMESCFVLDSQLKLHVPQYRDFMVSTTIAK